MNWFLVFVCVLFFIALGNDGAEAAEAVVNTVTAPVTLQDSLVSIITQVQSGVQSGVSFLQAEIPDVIRQLLVWKAVEASIWAGMHLLLVIAGVAAFINCYKVINEQNRLEAIESAADSARDAVGRHHDTFAALNQAYTDANAASTGHLSRTVIGCIIGIIWTVVGIISLCNIWDHIMTVAQIHLAPKVWLIEYAASLVK